MKPDSVENFMNSITIYSDLICPWCYIGKRRMEDALRQLPGGANVSWHPFQLNPDMAREGMNRKVYRSNKFGNWERSLAMDAQVTDVGKSVGIEFRYDLQSNTPNTFDSHRLVWFAGVHGVQDSVVEALFRGYFCEGVNFSERKNLLRVATSAGLNEAKAELFLESDEGVAEVRFEEQCARKLGISGVPFYVINKSIAFSGAQPPEMFIEAFCRAKELPREASQIGINEETDGCGPDGCKVPQ
jgi:predicted DsbA family dithiol-disulfide isomerase